MSDPIVTMRQEEEGEGDALRFHYDFPADVAPATSSNVDFEVEWRPVGKPPVRETDVMVVRWGRTRTRDPVEGWPDDDHVTRGASVSFPRRYYQGVVQLSARWTPQTDPSAPRTHTHTEPMGSQVNELQDEVAPAVEPVLASALAALLSEGEQATARTTSPEPAGDARFAFRGQLIHRALHHIHARLQAGLGGYWYAMGEKCRDSSGRKALCECSDTDLDAATDRQLEECWTQLAIEMLIGTFYNGPGWYHDAPRVGPGSWDEAHRRDSGFFTMVRDRLGASQPELVTSLVYACQQLTTAALMTRSADFAELAGDPLDCGAPEPHGSLTGKRTHIGDSGNASGQTLHDNGWLAPAACYFRRPGARHVALVVRASESTRFQLLDTSGWNIGTRPFSGMNFDTPGADALPNPLNGVLVPPQVEPATLRTALRALRNARPLGVARLVFARRSGSRLETLRSERVYWVSRKLQMFEGSGEGFVHYPVTRLLACLRGMPHRDALDVRWQLWVPLGQPALENAFAHGRTTRWWETGSTATERAMRPVAELGLDTNGRPTIVQRNTQGSTEVSRFPAFLDTLETATNGTPELRTAFPGLADVDQTQFPEFFRK